VNSGELIGITMSNTMEKASHTLTVITGFDNMPCIQKTGGPYQKSCTSVKSVHCFTSQQNPVLTDAFLPL